MKNNTSWIVTGVAVALIIGGMVWYSSQPGKYDSFAACIKESGATFYGAFWCPHCQEQKKLFGRSAKELPYVECSTPDGRGQLPICIEKKVETYPTWHFSNASTTTGTLSLAQISQFTGCPLVTDTEN